MLGRKCMKEDNNYGVTQLCRLRKLVATSLSAIHQSLGTPATLKHLDAPIRVKATSQR